MAFFGAKNAICTAKIFFPLEMRSHGPILYQEYVQPELPEDSVDDPKRSCRNPRFSD